MRKSIYSMIAVAALVPAAVSAQSTAASAQGTAHAASQASVATTKSNADASSEARIHASIEKAASQGVPRSTLENKVAEGRAKGVAEARIASAIEHRADVLMRVQAAMQKSEPQTTTPTPTDKAEPEPQPSEATTAAELTAAADAYENGVSLGSIVSVAARAGEKRGLALTVLSTLVANGNTAPSQALARVEAALNAGGGALAQLGSSASANAAANRPAANAPANAGTAKKPSVTGTITGAAAATIGH